MAGVRNGGGDLNFEAELFKVADKLRGNLEPSEYKHVALGIEANLDLPAIRTLSTDAKKGEP
jgi:type I restriction-modification system DNA methylase subunit